MSERAAGRRQRWSGAARRPGLLVAALVTALTAAAVGVVLSRSDQPLSRAATTLAAVHDVTVIHPDGSHRRGRDGMRLAAGDVVRTASDGWAQLRTRSRITRLEGASVVAVQDGARQQLRTGSAVVDATHGPGLTLAVGDDTVQVPAGGATEADRSASIRVGQLAGAAELTGPAGRRLSVPALHQAAAAGDSLPTGSTPLRLTDDAAEAATAPRLVAEDLALRQLAAGVDRTGAATAGAVEASWTGRTAPMAAGVPRSEAVLPVVIADATWGGSRQQRYDHAVDWRRQGGSWGVVLELLGGRSGAVLAVFDSLSRKVAPGGIAAVTAALARGGSRHARGGGGPSTAGGGATGATTGGHGTGAGTGTRRTSGGSGSAGPPTPAPSPSQGLVGGLVTTTNHLLSGVLSLLPTPAPSASGGLLPGLGGR